MVSINTNLSSLIVQNNLAKSTNALNTAIERMTTGFKINHASDNAAGYSIAQNLSNKLSSYDVASDNISSGIDLLSTAQDTISLMQAKGERLMALWTQAQNGTYGQQSIDAMNAEAQALVSEINRMYSNAEYNGIDIFNGIELPDWAEDITAKAEYNGFIADPKTYTDDQVSAMNSLSSVNPTTTISSGTYKISSKDELKQLATMVNSGKVTGGTFVLANDIDLGGEEWTAIGTRPKQFKGTFDGNGHKISNLKIDKEGVDNQGLFGYAGSGSTIKNVGVENVDVKGGSNTGGLAGNASNITNCYTTGSVTGGDYTGGLAGCANSITTSYSTGSVTAYYAFGVRNSAGGLAGYASSITTSYATGSVTGGDYTGGLVGFASNSITNSYSTGSVTGSNCTGGLVGINDGGTISTVAYNKTLNPTLNAVGSGSASNVTEITYTPMTLQVGINGDSSSQITVDTSLSVNLNISDISSASAYNTIKSFLDQLSNKATELGAASNRLESALESTMVSIENVTSSLSTIRDADIATVSSDYIKQQILQQASATLLATANQSPAIALQLI